MRERVSQYLLVLGASLGALDLVWQLAQGGRITFHQIARDLTIIVIAGTLIPLIRRGAKANVHTAGNGAV